jgi:hypothetical protein
MNTQSDRQAALDYHEFPTPGKISVVASKPLVNQRDLALAYSPGVAAACEEIVADPANVYRYTGRGNLVGVITNGTAVLGLGNIGALASKPVMEGKAVLFRSSPAWTCTTSKSTRPTRTNWSRSSRAWKPPSAASTSKTSRPRSASPSSASCASA